jgi:hypothetical protein
MILVKLGKELEDGKFSFICILQIESIKTALSLTTPVQEMSSFLIKKLDKLICFYVVAPYKHLYNNFNHNKF